METKTYIGIIVGLLVSSLILVAMVPIFTEVTATENQFTNKGMFNANSIDEESNYTMVWEYTEPTTITVNDSAIDMSGTDTTYSSVTVLFTNDWFVRYVVDSGLILYKCGTSASTPIGSATISSETNFSLTIASGSATIIIGENTYDYTVADDGVAIISEPGNYVIKKSTESAYVNGDSAIYGIGRTERALGVPATSFNAMVKATIDDGVTPLYYSPQYDWSDEYSISSTAVASYIDLYQVTGFTFNLLDTDEVEHPVTYNQIFVPSEVTAEKTVHGDTAFNSVINIIPMLAGVGLLLIALGVLIYRRM